MNTLHVNVGLARYSDWAFTSAVVALVVALLLLAFEFAQVLMLPKIGRAHV